jgi:hypothetical protein
MGVCWVTTPLHVPRCHGGGSSIEYPSSALTYRVVVPNGDADGVGLERGDAGGVGAAAVATLVGLGDGTVTATSRGPTTAIATTAATIAAAAAASAAARLRLTGLLPSIRGPQLE